jgi:putative SOS response-associated peptidase YedK
MCGRFTLQIPPELLAEIFGLAEIPVFQARYNIAPSQQVPVIRQTTDSHNSLDFLRWGLIPSWAKDKSIGNKMINARSETAAEKPAFRHAIKYRRCLIPSSGFYEWEVKGGKKVPLYVHLKDRSPMVFAGLWEHWKTAEGEVIESFAILTTSSNRLIAVLHDRMPVILHPEEYAIWLDRNVTEPEKLKSLYQPYPAELIEMYPVSSLVNSPKNDSEDLIQPVSETISST